MSVLKGIGYDYLMFPAEHLFLGRWRSLLVSRAEGEVLEIGVGTGLNFPYYGDVSLVGVDPDQSMLYRARSRAMDIDLDVSLLSMKSENLLFKDNSFDTVVSTFVFCNVNPVLSLNEIERVCRDGGRLLLLEHVKPRNYLIDCVFRAFNPFSRRFFGENLRRQPLKHLGKTGFSVECVRRIGFVMFVECFLED